MSATRIGTAVVSASMAIVATNAMAYVASESKASQRIDRAEGADEALRQKVNAAVAKRDVRMAVSEAFSVLASNFGDEDSTLAAKYFPNTEAKVAQMADFVGPGNCYSNCYSNCHSACHSACHAACHFACHGSRGWR